eukprot:6573099-Pyramimonas_sp.AAC.1
MGKGALFLQQETREVRQQLEAPVASSPCQCKLFHSKALRSREGDIAFRVPWPGSLPDELRPAVHFRPRRTSSSRCAVDCAWRQRC